MEAAVWWNVFTTRVCLRTWGAMRADAGDCPQIWRAKRCLFSFRFQPLPTGLFSLTYSLSFRAHWVFQPTFPLLVMCVWTCMVKGCRDVLWSWCKLLENVHFQLCYIQQYYVWHVPDIICILCVAVLLENSVFLSPPCIRFSAPDSLPWHSDEHPSLFLSPFCEINWASGGYE